MEEEQHCACGAVLGSYGEQISGMCERCAGQLEDLDGEDLMRIKREWSEYDRDPPGS